jgi:hypothetical protein
MTTNPQGQTPDEMPPGMSPDLFRALKEQTVLLTLKVALARAAGVSPKTLGGPLLHFFDDSLTPLVRLLLPVANEAVDDELADWAASQVTGTTPQGM